MSKLWCYAYNIFWVDGGKALNNGIDFENFYLCDEEFYYSSSKVFLVSIFISILGYSSELFYFVTIIDIICFSFF